MTLESVSKDHAIQQGGASLHQVTNGKTLDSGPPECAPSSFRSGIEAPVNFDDIISSLDECTIPTEAFDMHDVPDRGAELKVCGVEPVELRVPYGLASVLPS